MGKFMLFCLLVLVLGIQAKKGDLFNQLQMFSELDTQEQQKKNLKIDFSQLKQKQPIHEEDSEDDDDDEDDEQPISAQKDQKSTNTEDKLAFFQSALQKKIEKKGPEIVENAQSLLQNYQSTLKQAAYSKAKQVYDEDEDEDDSDDDEDEQVIQKPVQKMNSNQKTQPVENQNDSKSKPIPSQNLKAFLQNNQKPDDDSDDDSEYQDDDEEDMNVTKPVLSQKLNEPAKKIDEIQAQLEKYQHKFHISEIEKSATKKQISSIEEDDDNSDNDDSSDDDSSDDEVVTESEDDEIVVSKVNQNKKQQNQPEPLQEKPKEMNKEVDQKSLRGAKNIQKFIEQEIQKKPQQPQQAAFIQTSQKEEEPIVTKNKKPRQVIEEEDDSDEPEESIDEDSEAEEEDEEEEVEQTPIKNIQQGIISKVKVQSATQLSAKPPAQPQNMVSCDEGAAKNACKLCDTSNVQLVENLKLNEPIKTQFQELLDYTIRVFGPAKYYIAFSDNLICLTGDHFKQQVNLDKVLKHFTGNSIKSYQSTMFNTPTQIVPQVFQVEARFEPEKHAFSFKNFMVSTDLQIEYEMPGGFEFKTHTVEFQQKQQAIVYDGEFGQVGQFHLDVKEQGQKSELLVENVSIPKDNSLIQNLADQYLGGEFKESVRAFRNQMKEPFNGDLQINTITTNDHIAISFNLHRQDTRAKQ